MKGEIKSEREVLDSRIGRLEWAVAGAGVLVVVGLLMECGPEIKAAIIARRLPSRDIIGNLIVTVGVAFEVLFSFLIARYAGRLQVLANAEIAVAQERIASLNLLAEQERLARVRLEQKFSARKITDESAARLERLLVEYAGMRIDVYAWDSHSMEVRILADTMNAILLKAGLRSVLWHVGAGVRMAGDDITFGVARDVAADEKAKLQSLGWALGGPILDSSIKFTVSIGGFATTDPHVPNTMFGWSPESIDDTAPARLQIVQRVVVDPWSADQLPTPLQA
jgi:hypothetical protein